jgi:hypothetical protein
VESFLKSVLYFVFQKSILWFVLKKGISDGATSKNPFGKYYLKSVFPIFEKAKSF